MSDDLAFAAERSFLAREFLTWLWFRCEAEGGEFELDGREIALVVEDALSLVGWDEDGTKVSVRGGTPTLTPGAAGALGAGLLLKKAKLLLAEGEREWHFSLDGETLDLGSVKVPEIDEDEDDPLAAKLELGEELALLVDLLFREFLALRLEPDWDRIEIPRIRDWVQVKLDKAWAAVGAA